MGMESSTVEMQENLQGVAQTEESRLATSDAPMEGDESEAVADVKIIEKNEEVARFKEEVDNLPDFEETKVA